MKKILLIITCISSYCVSAQTGTLAPWMNENTNQNLRIEDPTFEDIVTSFEDFWEDKDETVRGSGYKPFKRWESLYKYYLNPDKTVIEPEQLWSAWRSKNSHQNRDVDNSNWQNVGPLTHTNTGSWSSGQGRVNAIEIDPINTNIWYVGTPAGGIWKSIDSGESWSPLSDDLPQIGVSGIAIDPTNTDVIYIATGDDDGGDSLSVGVLKSTDGGNTWNTTGLNENNSPSSMNDIYIDPANNNILWVATNQGIYKTIDGGNSWNVVRIGNFQDLKIKPGSSDILYAATSSIIFRSLDAGDTWEPVSNGFINGAARIVLDVTPANNDVLYAFVSDSSFGSGEIYKSDNEGSSFTRTFNGSTDIFETTQAWFDMAFAVSDTNEDEIYTGILNVWRSTNSGTNFVKLNNWNQPNSPSYTHADIHILKTIGNTIYCGSDGGIYASTDNGSTFTSYTDGLAIGQFYKIDVAKSDASIISGGLQDNGGYARLNDNWQNYYGADGMENLFNPEDPSIVYGFTQRGGGLWFSENGGASLDGSFSGPEQGEWITPLAFTKDNRLFAGYQSVYELDFCSNSWVLTSPSFNETIDKLETDPNQANVMYIATGRTLRRSIDTGASFSVEEVFTNDITSIEVHNEDSSIIYVVTSGTNGNVYKGTVSDDSISFEEITGSLPNIPKLVIKHQALTDDNTLYLGTALGVWRYNDILSDWETFDNNLPNTAVRDLDINILNGILTAGTFGRGIWQTAIEATVITNDVAASFIGFENDVVVSCGESSTSFSFINNGNTSITEAAINYEAGGIQNTLNWTGLLEQGQTATVSLPSLGLETGTYELSIEIITQDDQILDNNSKSSSIYINELGEGNTLNDFETSDNNLLVVPDNINSTSCNNNNTVWERGNPNGTILNSASSGAIAYGTNLNGNYPDNIKEFLTTNCYDISSLDIPTLSFNMIFDLELNWDILYVEYSIDNGENWSILGSADDENWYNSDTTPGSNCLNCPGAQWTGINTTYTNYSYDLSEFASETSMMFRFVFHSDQSVNEEGVVIDDLEIGQAPLSTEEIVIEGLSIFPNPSNGLFTINWSEATSLDIEVFDILGKSILKNKTTPGNTSHILDMSKYTPGLYLLKVNYEDKQVTKKLILN